MSSANEVETADANPITFGSGEPYTLALLIRWTENPWHRGHLPRGLVEQRQLALDA